MISRRRVHPDAQRGCAAGMADFPLSAPFFGSGSRANMVFFTKICLARQDDQGCVQRYACNDLQGRCGWRWRLPSRCKVGPREPTIVFVFGSHMGIRSRSAQSSGDGRTSRRFRIEAMVGQGPESRRTLPKEKEKIDEDAARGSRGGCRHRSW